MWCLPCTASGPSPRRNLDLSGSWPTGHAFLLPCKNEITRSVPFIFGASIPYWHGRPPCVRTSSTAYAVRVRRCRTSATAQVDLRIAGKWETKIPGGSNLARSSLPDCIVCTVVMGGRETLAKVCRSNLVWHDSSVEVYICDEKRISLGFLGLKFLTVFVR